MSANQESVYDGLLKSLNRLSNACIVVTNDVETKLRRVAVKTLRVPRGCTLLLTAAVQSRISASKKGRQSRVCYDYAHAHICNRRKDPSGGPSRKVLGRLGIEVTPKVCILQVQLFVL